MKKVAMGVATAVLFTAGCGSLGGLDEFSQRATAAPAPVALQEIAADQPVVTFADEGGPQDTLALPNLTMPLDDVPVGLAVGVHRFGPIGEEVIQWESRAGWHHGYERGDSPHFTVFSRGDTPDAPSYSVRIINWEPSLNVGEHGLSREGLHLVVNVPGPDGGQRGGTIDRGVLVINDIVDPEFGEFPTYIGEMRGQSSDRADEPGGTAKLSIVVRFHAPYTSPY